MNFTMSDLKTEFNDDSVVSHYNNLDKQFGLTYAEQTIIQKYIKKDAKILEIGCGTGRICNNLYKLGYHDIFAIDISSGMVKSAKQNAKQSGAQIKFKTISATRLKSLGLKFDAVIFGYNGFCDIPNIKNRILVLQNVYQILNENGIFIFSTQDRGENLDKYGEYWENQKTLFQNGEKKDIGDLVKTKFNNVKTYVNVPLSSEVFELLKQSKLNLIFTEMTRNLTNNIKNELGDFRFYVAKK